MTGRYTALRSPLLVDGLLCSGAAVFASLPDSPADPVPVCSGTVESHSSGRAVFERAFQPYSRLVVEGVGDSRQERFECLMGGNIASTKDPERGLSELATGDTQSRRGDDARRRVRPGDLAYYETGGIRRSGVVKAAEAYAIQPAQIAWQSATPVPRLTGYAHEVGVHQAERVGLFAPTDAGVFGFTGVFDGATELSRINFITPENYPADAAIGAGEYWYSNNTGLLRYGSTAGATLEIRYAAGPFATLEAGRFIMDGEPGQRAFHEAIGNVSTVVEIESSGADGYGRGFYEWRIGYGADAPFVGVRWDEANLVELNYRTTPGGVINTTPLNEPLSGQFFLFISRSGTNVTIDYDIGGTPGTAGVIGFGGQVENNTLATIAFGGGGVPYIAQSFDATRQLLAAFEILYEIVEESFSNTGAETTLTLPGAEAITSVVNETTGATMTASATPRRDTYRQDAAGEITLYGPSALDAILVTQAPPAVAPGGPGIPPRMPGTSGYADGDARAHWSDAVEFEDGWLPPVGANVQFMRGAVFSPDNPPTIYYDQPGGSSTDWREVPLSAIRGRWGEGVVFFAKEFVDELPPRVCFQARGRIWNHDGSLKAAQLEALATRVELIDELWASVGLVGEGFTTTIGASNDSRAVRNQGVVCEGPTTKRIDYAYAFSAAAGIGLADEFASASATAPAWRSGVELILGRGFEPFTTAWRDAIIGNCDGNDLTRVDIDGLPDGVKIQRAFPFTAAGALAGNYVGSFVPGFTGTAASCFDGTAQFIAPAIGATPLLARLAGLGAICIEAKARVRFPGLEFFSFRHEYQTAVRSLVDGGSPSGDLTGFARWFYNGQLVFESETNSSGTTTVATPNPDPFPDPIDTGPIGFSLIGEEFNSERIIDIFGTTHNVRSSRFRTLGTVSPQDAGNASRNWRVMDFTSIVNTILNDKTRATNYLLWPRVGNSPPTPGTGLAAYLDSLESSVSLEADELAADLTRLTGSAENGLARWTSLEIDSIHARFRLPDGIEETIRIPLLTQPPLA